MDETGRPAAVQQRLRIVVEGLVQGVGFRYATARQARRVHVRGWVRNRSDGAVEVLAEGDADNVRALADWCRAGPPGARVTSVQEGEEAVDRPLQGFDIRY